MTMRRAASALLLLAITVAVPARAGLFSRPATSVAEVHGTARPMSVAAPDDSTRAVARFMNGKLTVFAGIRYFDFADGPNAELLWSPDSDAIAVTSNADADDDGGRFLATILIRQTVRKWKRIDLTRPIGRLLPHLRGCDDLGPPDVAVLGWTSGQRLIVAAARPPERACGARRMFTGFVVDVPSGEILMSMDEHMLKRRYHALLGKAVTRRDWKPAGEGDRPPLPGGERAGVRGSEP